MPRISPIDPTTATGETAAHLATARKMFGGTPNLITTAANSSAAVGAMVSLFAAVGKSTLGAKTGALLALAVAPSPGCRYCLSAHSAIGSSLGFTQAALAAAQHAKSTDRRIEALLTLAVAINQSRGQLADATLAAARAAGVTDAEIVDVVAHVALNVFTNYLNNVAQTTIDFPVVPVAAAA